MNDADLMVETAGGIASIDLNRPNDGNALTMRMMCRLSESLRGLGRNRKVRTVVVRARGAEFCRGRDVSGEIVGGPIQLTRTVLDVYAAIADVPVPVIACVQGPAIGFGAALAAACDITLASAAARFRFPEIEHGIPPVLAMSAVIRCVPLKALDYLIYSAEAVDAESAVALGLASRVFPAARFEAEVAAFLTTLASRPRLVVETVKRFHARAATLSTGTARDYAGALLALVGASIAEELQSRSIDDD